MEEKAKICPRCKQEKPFSEFFNDRQRSDGKTYLCKVCHEAGRKKRKQAKSQDDSNLKRCSCCGMLKPLTEFYRNKNERDGLKRWCKSCKPSLLAKKLTENAC